MVSATGAHAWGREAHRLVADLAMEQLTPAARVEADRLLALEPGASLASVSTWPDEFRSPTSSAWHYVNFRQGEPCGYSEVMCPGGACIVAAIDRQGKLLASSAPGEERLKALKYIVHFVADLHQPLHAGFLEDRGGNQYQVQSFGRGSNLHAAWDVGLIENWPGGIEQLKQQVRARRAVDAGGTPADWAEESCRIVSAPAFYPQGRVIEVDYQQRWAQTVIERLAHAASRLAQGLNVSLGKR
jgi:hypothetical protein